MKVFLVGVAVFVAACSLPSVGLWSGKGAADTGLYRLYGEKLADGHVPYRAGFSLEFPPGALVPLTVPALPGGHYVVWFHVFEALCGVAAVGAVAYLRHAYLPVLAAAVSPAVLGAITLNAFDLWPAALTAWAIALSLRRHPGWGFALLGAATAAKLYPVLLAPVLLVYLGREQARRALLAGCAVLACAFLPFAVLGPGGLKFSVQQQLTRGLQAESLGGSLLGVLHRLGAGFHVVTTHAPFSFDVAGSTADAVATISSLLLLAAVAVVWFRLRRGRVDDGRTLLAVAATAIAFVAFSKVLSPQYLLFLVPVVPLAPSALAPAGLIAALGLTQVWVRFPEPFLRTVHFHSSLVWVVLARNLVLVALYVFLVNRLRRATRSA